MATQITAKREVSLGIFEKYLTLWIAICIVLGLLVGRFFPQFGQFMDSLKFGQLSIPIGILLFFMMYPTVLGIRFSDIKQAAKRPKPLLVTVIANWVIAPPLMTLYANLMLTDPMHRAGVILLGLSPCTAMVMWWMYLAKGDLAQGLINTAINALLMLFLYAPLAALYLGVSSIPVPWDLIAISVLAFIALPVAAGAISRRVVVRRKGEEWFDGVYRPLIGKISIVALLTTLIVLFSFEGEVILSNPLLVAYLAAPNLLHYATMIAWTYPLGYFAGWPYESAIDTTIIGASSHFEVAIAVATTLYGIGSGAALATVIGPLMEVPLMLSLVKLGLYTRKYFPRKRHQIVQ
ncbi:MAG: ACR3 family arsenite efflux transporter [Candidatus Bathyarchaeota archaeon]|nr:ACR3 family arsenite efflux transporter [Candidatus Bathyarchaeota archaeon]MCX8177662.1 ACR3 family arsenite efflux transporter [Candidatus Bathyarchaeota archaeon]MDW8193917.1 ACR3 family arsenite efflux transporter [Nitrososphaerota archaeon]